MAEEPYTSTPISPPTIAEQIYKKNLELLQERRRAEQLLYSVSEIVFAVDLKSNLTIFNHAAENYLGIKVDDALGKQVDEIIILQDEKGKEVKSNEYCFQSDPKKAKMDGLVLNTKSSAFFINLKTSVIVHDEENTECVVTLSDVTRERQLDKSKDEFVNITSHELRTPLTIIKSYLWMLDNNKAGELNDKQKNYLKKAMIGAEEMLALINDTLNVARIEQDRITMTIEKIDITQMVMEIIEEIGIRASEKNLFLKPVFSDPIWKIYADKSKLHEVFLNFLSNSIKYTQNGGISIKIENLGNDEVKVSIIDTGMGIKSGDLPRLFNKFGRLDSSFSTVAEVGGTGLGLYITKSIIEKMGGRVGVESEGTGKGSTFWFTLVSENNKSKIIAII